RSGSRSRPSARLPQRPVGGGLPAPRPSTPGRRLPDVLPLPRAAGSSPLERSNPVVQVTDRQAHTLAVRFLKPWQTYMRGDVASFPAGTAEALVFRSRVAEAVNLAGSLPPPPDPNRLAQRTPPRHVTK